MNLDNAYRVELHKRRRTMVQYVEAGSVDEAISAASRTFDARLLGYDDPRVTSTTQKACRFTKLTGKLRFSFKGGWTTVDCEGLTIYEALERAKTHPITDGEIDEIGHAISDAMAGKV